MKHRDELKKAEIALAAVGAATTVAGAEEHWKEFLRRLDRIWNKANAHFCRDPRWFGWKSSYSCLRTSDPLLSYLMQARNSDEHNTEPVTGTEFFAGPGRDLTEGGERYVQFGRVMLSGIRIEGAEGTVHHVVPLALCLPCVVNRGKTFHPPVIHLEKPVDPNNPKRIGELALHFYEEFLTAAETAFAKAA